MEIDFKKKREMNKYNKLPPLGRSAKNSVRPSKDKEQQKLQARMARTIRAEDLTGEKGIGLLLKGYKAFRVPKKIRNIKPREDPPIEEPAQPKEDKPPVQRQSVTETVKNMKGGMTPEEKYMLRYFARYMAIFTNWSNVFKPGIKPELVLRAITTKLKRKADLTSFVSGEQELDLIGNTSGTSHGVVASSVGAGRTGQRNPDEVSTENDDIVFPNNPADTRAEASQSDFSFPDSSSE